MARWYSVESLLNAKEFIITNWDDTEYIFTQEFVSIGNSKFERTISVKIHNKIVKVKSFTKILRFFFALCRERNIIVKTTTRKVRLSGYGIKITVPGVIVGEKGKKQWLVPIEE